MKIQEALSLLNSKFEYRADRSIDIWRVMHGDDKWQGDCEDYALTLMWLISDRNIFKFFWNITAFQVLVWFVSAPNGEGHVVVKIDGMYYDNIQQQAMTKEELITQGYKFKFPMIFPIVYFKLLISYTIGVFVKS